SGDSWVAHPLVARRLRAEHRAKSRAAAAGRHLIGAAHYGGTGHKAPRIAGMLAHLLLRCVATLSTAKNVAIGQKFLIQRSAVMAPTSNAGHPISRSTASTALRSSGVSAACG